MEQKRILIIDDDSITRLLIQSFLKTENQYIVDSIESAQSGLAFIKHNDIDLIVSDIEMDGMDGYELSQSLLLEEKTSSIPVILLSIRDEDDVRRKSRDFSNIKKVVQKPYFRDQLLSDIEELIN